MTIDLPPSAHDLRHLDPEMRKERVKLASNGLNAIGLALLIGSVVAPIVDASRQADSSRIVIGILLGLAFLLVAYLVLRYIKAREFS